MRELSNVLERAVALGEHDAITVEDLSGVEGLSEGAQAAAGWGTLDEAVASGRPLEEVEMAYIRRVVEACGGNMSEAARRLGIDRRTLYRRMGERGEG